MAPNVQAKLEEVIKGNLKYTSANLGLNMLLSRFQRRVAGDPQTMAACVKEVDDFAKKYTMVLNEDFPKIAAL